MLKNFLMIINPKAGRNSKRQNPGDVVAAFRADDIECVEKTTTCSGDATEIVKKYSEGKDAIVCSGGDGTFNEVVSGMMQADVKAPLIYLPSGSTNDFANTLGITNDPIKAVDMYFNNETNTFDVGRFNDKYFGYIASFGAGTAISYGTSQKMKNKIGHAAYILNGFVIRLIPVLRDLKPIHMKIEHDGGVIEDDFYFGAISNTNEVSGLFKFDKCGVKLNDGLFEVILVRNANVVKAFKMFDQIRRQKYDGENFIMFKTSKIKITSDKEFPWTLDGEYGGSVKEADIEVKKHAVEIVSPKGKFLD